MRQPGTSDFIVTDWNDLYKLRENSNAIEVSLFYDYRKSYCPKCNKMSSISEYDLHHIKMVCGHHLEGITVFYPLEKANGNKEDRIIEESLENMKHMEYGFFYHTVKPEDLECTKDVIYRKKSYEKDISDYQELRNSVRKTYLNKQTFFDENNLPLDFIGCSLEFNPKNNKISASFYRIARDKYSTARFKKNIPIDVETYLGVIGKRNFGKLSYETCLEKEKSRLNWIYEEEDKNPFVPEFQWPQRAIDFLHEAVNISMGRNITYSPALKGLNLLRGTCLYPYEPNFIVTDDFFNCFNISNCPDIMSAFLAEYKCKPFRTLRRLFQTNPKVLIEYTYLIECGFRKTDIITSLLVSENFSKVFEEFCKDSMFKFFVKSMLETKSENLTAKFLQTMDVNQEYLHDSIRMFNVYYDQITPEFKKTIFKEGFTEYNHNVLSKISYITRFKPVTFSYTKEQLSLETEIDGYKFLLPQNSDKLIEIGQKMHNCVASYRDKILEKRCTIVYAVKDDDYKVCIEVIDSKVQQELCDRNTRPKADVKEVLKKWHIENNLKTRHIY